MRFACAVLWLALAPACLAAAPFQAHHGWSSAAAARPAGCARARLLWHRLRLTPIAGRGPLLARLRHFAGCGQIQERAIFLSARLDAALGAAGRRGGYRRAARRFYRLLQLFPYGRYRREADWDLAQIELRVFHEARPAQARLRDFLHRYPADPRVPLARSELRGVLPREAFLPSSGGLIVGPPPAALAAAAPSAEAAARPPAGQNVQSGSHAARQALERQRWAYDANPLPVPASLPAPHRAGLAAFESLRVWSNQDVSHIVLRLSGPVGVASGYIWQNRRLYFDLSPCQTAWRQGERSYNLHDRRLLALHAADHRPGVVRVVLDETPLAGAVSLRYFPNPSRLVITVATRPEAWQPPRLASAPPPYRPPAAAAVYAPLAAPARPSPRAAARLAESRRPQRVAAARPAATPPAARSRALRVATPLPGGSRSLTRALDLGVRRVVIDPGHGGHDTGTIGPNGLLEKNLVLNVALRLGRLLRRRLGVQVVYTRDTDVFIPLQQRTAIANRAHADLFVSIHANASPDPTASGIETYFLDFTRDPSALAVAARENASSDYDIHNLDTLIRKIAAHEKQTESKDLARDIESSLARNMEQHYRGVKSAPFIVLIGARMPSVLAEISFLSDPYYARRLALPAYRERIAYALYLGIRRYLNSLGQTPARAALARTRLPRAAAHLAEH